MYQEDNQVNYYNPYECIEVATSLPATTATTETITKKKRKSLKIIPIITCCVLAGLTIGATGATIYFNTNDGNTSDDFISAATTLSAINTASVTGEELTATELYYANIDACVGITISNVSTNAFGQVSSSASSGSGFVITSDGYIVTNHHVIEDAIDNDSISIDVSFYNGSSYSATIVGYEEDNDIAILKIDATGLQTITLGDSDDILVGEAVYAIGNPLGQLTFTLTDGIISALDRLISTDSDTTMNMLQTNTAINPGNSGGPLFNSAGEVIGITTSKYFTSSTGSDVEGLGFAIPINDVIDIIVDIMEYGYVTGKPYLGVNVTSAQYYGEQTGAGISYVAEGGAADEAGIEVGDVIIAIDNTEINTSSALTAALTAYSAGDSIEITLMRDGEEMTLTVVLDEENTETIAANQMPTEDYSQSNGYNNFNNSQMPFNR